MLEEEEWACHRWSFMKPVKMLLDWQSVSLSWALWRHLGWGRLALGARDSMPLGARVGGVCPLGTGHADKQSSPRAAHRPAQGLCGAGAAGRGPTWQTLDALLPDFRPAPPLCTCLLPEMRREAMCTQPLGPNLLTQAAPNGSHQTGVSATGLREALALCF